MRSNLFRPVRGHRFAYAALLGVALVLLSPGLSRADLIAYRQDSGQLERHNLDTDTRETVGDLHALNFSLLEFDEKGRLWALTSNEIYRLDAQSGLPRRSGALSLDTGFELKGAAVSGGQIWYVAITTAPPFDSRLYRVGIDGGGAVTVATYEDRILDGLAFRGTELLAFGDGAIATVNLPSGTLTPLENSPEAGFGLTSTGDRFFTFTSPLVAPPTQFLTEIDLETGEYIQTFASTGIALGARPLPALREEGCEPSDTVLCFGGGRFAVSVDWRDFSGNGDQGKRLPWTSDDSGLFQFFGEDNWELLVKVLDGCAENDRVWVLWSASTNVAFDLKVRDTATGEERLYQNPLGERADSRVDTDAFAACPQSL